MFSNKWLAGATYPLPETRFIKIRVEVASAMFPLFSRNLNTGGHNEKETKFRRATQRVYHTAEYPSHVLLPVVEVE
ncbi:MAG: hypothetical protein NTW38_07075 [Candidatus Aminicenantes bacterium]|nr:hypothetical protein [Candidatus Aminicenantes bacterium]